MSLRPDLPGIESPGREGDYEDIFRDNQDRRQFLNTLGEACDEQIRRAWVLGSEAFRQDLHGLTPFMP